MEEFRGYLQTKNAGASHDDVELIAKAEDEITFLEIRKSTNIVLNNSEEYSIAEPLKSL